MFRKYEYVLKATRTHKSSSTPAEFRQEKTINTASVSSHVDLKNRVSDFWHMRLLFFLQENKVRKGKKIELPEKKRHNFLMRGIIKIRRHGFVGERSDNILSEFQPIWSRGYRLGTRNARTSLFFTFEKQRKNKIWRHPSVKRLSHQGRNHRGSTFYITIGK